MPSIKVTQNLGLISRPSAKMLSVKDAFIEARRTPGGIDLGAISISGVKI
jgi:hypothetical protein